MIKRAYLIICIVFALSNSAYAYLDPSVMTYTIQTFAGIAIALGAVVGIYWRKAKNKVKDKLGIDENGNKEIEEDIVEFEDEKK